MTNYSLMGEPIGDQTTRCTEDRFEVVKSSIINDAVGTGLIHNNCFTPQLISSTPNEPFIKDNHKIKAAT
jgi:hypothetical protein